MLVILGGLPGTGKSTIAQLLATQLQAVYLRIDSIEQAIRNTWDSQTKSHKDMGPDGYFVAYAVAADNLRLGQIVIADSVNPIEITRSDWRRVATDNEKPYIEIEIICSDTTVHKHRVETRQAEVQGLTMPSWKDVINRDYELWQTSHLTIDTATYNEADAVYLIINELNQLQST